MNKQNVIIFSAGESLRNGKVHYIKAQLTKKNISCTVWNDLFNQANDQNHLALLPTLIKKIPTFDFALVIAEGVDLTLLRQQENVTSIRDNVIFEIGLCVMGLGCERVILLKEKNVRIPDDLIGKNGIGLYCLDFDQQTFIEKVQEAEQIMARQLPTQMIDEIVQYILDQAKNISPVFVGASISLAESYFNNFVLRLVEHLDQPIYDATHHPIKPKQIQITIILPLFLEENIKTMIQNYYQRHHFDHFYIDDAGTRSIYFMGKMIHSTLHIVDIPTSITASYSVVRTILNIDSDAVCDENAEERFKAKEMMMFQYALLKFIKEDYLNNRLRDNDKKEKMIPILTQIKIEQEDIY